MAKKSTFPAGWNQSRVNAVLKHYEEQTEDEAVAEDEAAFAKRGQTVMVVPRRMVPAITKLIARGESAHQRETHTSSRSAWRPKKPVGSRGNSRSQRTK